jgi:predicted glycosyltransferase
MALVWVDLANSPHVALFETLVERLEREGWTVLLTARDHAQTVELARRRWPDVLVVGGASPAGLIGKATTLLSRAKALRRFAQRERPDVALSHGSYAQLLAARAAGVPAVTMMDYEHQPANHLSFRLARRVIVPFVFPESALRRCGADAAKVVRYPGFKEELYLADFEPRAAVVSDLGLDLARVISIMRPPPDGALYHRDVNRRFDEVVELAGQRSDVQSVLVPRNDAQARRYRALSHLLVPDTAVDTMSLLGLADVSIGGGGTMNRESALLGTPTYTVFAGRLAAVDAELMRLGWLRDLRQRGTLPLFEKKASRASCVSSSHSGVIQETVLTTITDVARDKRA